MQRITLDEALATGRGNERSFCCPVHDDSNASASVNVAKGVWYCFACHANGTIEGHVPSPEDIIKVLAGEKPPRLYPEAWLDLFDAHGPSSYWSSRYGEDTATAHRCGTHYENGAPTYPIRLATGELLGVVTRHEDSKAKYLYPSGIRTSATFFGDLERKPVVVLVEGASDVMALHQAGIPEHWTVLGCFGSGLHKPQVDLLNDMSPKLFVAAFDDDNAGNGAKERAIYQLRDVAPVLSHPWNNFGGGDPGEVPVAQRITSVRQTISNSPYRKHS